MSKTRVPRDHHSIICRLDLDTGIQPLLHDLNFGFKSGGLTGPMSLCYEETVAQNTHISIPLAVWATTM